MSEVQFDLEAGISEAMDGVLFLKQALCGMRELAQDYVTCLNEFDPCISQVDRVEHSLVDVFEHLPAKAIELDPDPPRPHPGGDKPQRPSLAASRDGKVSERTILRRVSSGVAAPMLDPPAFPSVELTGASTGGVHVPQEIEDLGYDLELVYQAVRGMQANADDSETEPKHFEPILLFMQRIQDRVELLDRAMDRLISPPRLDQEHPAKMEPKRQGKEPAINHRVPAAKGNGKEARAARA